MKFSQSKKYKYDQIKKKYEISRKKLRCNPTTKKNSKSKKDEHQYATLNLIRSLDQSLLSKICCFYLYTKNKRPKKYLSDKIK